jgi:hypothetical protein
MEHFALEEDIYIYKYTLDKFNFLIMSGLNFGYLFGSNKACSWVQNCAVCVLRSFVGVNTSQAKM